MKDYDIQAKLSGVKMLKKPNYAVILKTIIKSVDKDTVSELFEAFIGQKMTERQAMDAIVEIIDGLIDFEKIIPNEQIGKTMEAIDGKIIALIVKLIIKSK